MDSLPGLDPKGMMATFDRTDALNGTTFISLPRIIRYSVTRSTPCSVAKKATPYSPSIKVPKPWYFPASHLLDVLHLQFTYRSLPRHLSYHSLARSYWEIISAPDLSAEHLNHSPDTDDILGNRDKRLVKKMRKSAESHMFQVTEDLVEEARVSVEQELQSEISRLQNLARLNPSVDQSEIKNLQTHQAELEEALAESRFRLDSLHLIVVEN